MTERERIWLEDLERLSSEMNSRYSGLLGMFHGPQDCVYEKVLYSLVSLGFGLVRERREYGFGCGDFSTDEGIYRSEREILEFSLEMMEVLIEGRDYVRGDFSGYTREWFMLEMAVKYGLVESEVKERTWKVVKRAVESRVGVMDLRRPVGADNCYLSLIEVF